VLVADDAARQQALGGASRPAQYLATVRAAILLIAAEGLRDGPIVDRPTVVADHLKLVMAGLPAEQLRVLFLNARNRLIREEVVAFGSVDRVTICPRAIVKRALELNATALILAHNHPSGDPAPSVEDIAQTAAVAAAAATFDIVVHDHLIVARSGWASLRALGNLA
jgi:DNA repair protein RadC